MIRLGAVLLALWPLNAAAQDGLDLPSGQKVELIETIANVPGDKGLALRFRFLAPAIAREGGAVDAEAAAMDMDWLCHNFALPMVDKTAPQPAEIIISMSDRDVPFGQSDPEATQFFNAYSIDGETCLWEPF